MSKRKRAKRPCKGCHGYFKQLSRKGLCPDCGVSRTRDSITQMQEGKGEIYDKWFEKSMAGLMRKEADKLGKDHENKAESQRAAY